MIIQERDVRIKNIVEEIRDGEIDLRPDFQRGEVWAPQRKKLLIDSILRGWHIPPIHVVHVEGQPSEVLDGQQRLTTISEFYRGAFSIDGNIEPLDEGIRQLHGRKYEKLIPPYKERFDKYLLKIYEIKDYEHGEPGELFHRLNQSVKLTSAEQRNAFFGKARDEMAHLVKIMSELKVGAEILGFGNSRMAYNDLLVRISVHLEQGSIRAVVSDKSLTLRFRSEQGFDEKILSSVQHSIEFVHRLAASYGAGGFSLTKASSFSWMYFIAHQTYIGSTEQERKFSNGFFHLETARTAIKTNLGIPAAVVEFFAIPEKNLREFILLYIDRSSSRVTSLGSIVMRDLSVYFTCYRAGCDFPFEESCYKSLVELGNSLTDENVDVKLLIETHSELWKGGLQ